MIGKEYCCNRLLGMVDKDIIKEEQHGKREKYFVHLKAFYDAPFEFVSTRLRFCPFCGEKL